MRESVSLWPILPGRYYFQTYSQASDLWVSQRTGRGNLLRMSDHIKDAAADLRDTAEEIKHRTVAEAEKLKRDALGDELTTGEKLHSGANELKNRAQAEIDKAKRELRDRT